MSFLDKISGKTRNAPDASRAELDADPASAINPMEATQRIGQGSSLLSDSSIISEAAPSELAADFSETRLPGEPDEGVASGLPIIGAWPTARQQRLLLGLFGLGLLGLIIVAIGALTSSGRSAVQVAAAGQAQTQSQRLAKSVSQALLGGAAAFSEVKDSVDVLARNVRSLANGEGGVPAAPGALQESVQKLLPLVDRAEKSAGTVLAQQKTLTQVGQSLRNINRQSADLLELAETVSSLKLQQGAAAAELSAVGQLVMLTQRIGKSANEFQTMEGVSPEAVFQLGKDLNSFREIADGLLGGNAELRLPGTRDAQIRERLQELLKQYETTRGQATAVLANLQGLVAARDAHTMIVNDSEPLRRDLGQLQDALAGSGEFGAFSWIVALLSVALMLAGGMGLLRLFVVDQTARSQVAESQRLEAERQEQEAKRVNDANQAAILRLMNELQTVAEGDLTQQATVTEDITGAIADSVNYTVEELRTLVEAVQNTVARVTETTQQVEQTSTELLAASTEQLREIRETGESVLQMAGRINDVSAQAQQTAQVARQSLEVAELGPDRGAEHHRRHERDPRPDPGHRQAHQAAGRVVAGNRRDHRADLGHHRADQRAGAQRRHPGRVGGRGGARLLGGGRGGAAPGRTLGRRDAADRRHRAHHPDRHPGCRRRHGALDAGRGRGRTPVRRRRQRAGRHRPCHAPAVGADRADFRAGLARGRFRQRGGREHPAHLRRHRADG
jgi:twitching motility protein PilJ